MPGPAIYVAAVIGTFAAVFVFKEVCRIYQFLIRLLS